MLLMAPRILPKESLLDALWQRSGCSYLSDLHNPQEFSRLKATVLELASESWSSEHWNAAASYILRNKNKMTAQQAQQALLDYFSAYSEEASS